MYNHDATEIAYRNGYEKGMRDLLVSIVEAIAHNSPSLIEYMQDYVEEEIKRRRGQYDA